MDKRKPEVPAENPGSAPGKEVMQQQHQPRTLAEEELRKQQARQSQS